MGRITINMNTMKLMATKPLLADLVALYKAQAPHVQVQVESVEVEGLADVRVHAGTQAGLAVLRHGIGREPDHRQPVAGGAQGAGGVQLVVAGKHQAADLFCLVAFGDAGCQGGVGKSR